jgi:glucosamine--fructose-6-phosphate aminotransferase (isomerizing)
MCGIFGFISTDGRGPDIDRLKHLALVTESRGRHAWGMAWLKYGKVETFKTPRPASLTLWSLDCVRSCEMMIAHCRYATHGSPQDNRNNHPHPAGKGWLVHNGVVQNYRTLVADQGLAPNSECDSEVIGLLMARGGGSLGRRVIRTLGLVTGDHALLGIWTNPARLLVARRGRPLHFGKATEGLYFASLPDGLPGRPHSLPDGYAAVFTLKNGEVQRTWEDRMIPF